jgi:predicted secreted protein
LIFPGERLTARWAMPNPQGVNSFDKFGTESAYGTVKKLTERTQAAPLKGAPSSAVNAPRRAQKRATRPKAAAGPKVDYPTAQAQVWSDILATPGISPLVAEYAQKAQQRLGNGSS